MDNKARIADEFDLEDRSRVPEAARNSKYGRHGGSDELQEDVASRIGSDAKAMNPTSDIRLDLANHSAGSEVRSMQIESLPNQNGSIKALNSVAVSEKKKADVPPIVPYFKLYKYADRVDILLMSLGTVMAVLDGFSWPVMALIQSKLLNSFAGSANQSPRHEYEEICKVSNIFIFTFVAFSTMKGILCKLYDDCLVPDQTNCQGSL